MLGVLDPASPVLLTVFFPDECKFIQDPIVGTVAYGMNRMLDIRFIGLPQDMFEFRASLSHCEL